MKYDIYNHRCTDNGVVYKDMSIIDVKGNILCDSTKQEGSWISICLPRNSDDIVTVVSATFNSEADLITFLQNSLDKLKQHGQ